MDSHCGINYGSEKSYHSLMYPVQTYGDWDEKALEYFRVLY